MRFGFFGRKTMYDLCAADSGDIGQYQTILRKHLQHRSRGLRSQILELNAVMPPPMAMVQSMLDHVVEENECYMPDSVEIVHPFDPF
jgi:hypothetical protein